MRLLYFYPQLSIIIHLYFYPLPIFLINSTFALALMMVETASLPDRSRGANKGAAC